MLRACLLASCLFAGCASSHPIAAPDILCIPLRNTTASEVMPILEDVLAPRHGAPAWRGVVDASTNTLAFSGTPEDLREVVDLVALLDTPPTPPPQGVDNERRIVLRHTPVEEVLPILEAVFCPGCSWPGPDGLYMPPKPTWHGEADAVSNTLILRGMPEVLQQIADTVGQLDVPAAAVR